MITKYGVGYMVLGSIGSFDYFSHLHESVSGQRHCSMGLCTLESARPVEGEGAPLRFTALGAPPIGQGRILCVVPGRGLGSYCSSIDRPPDRRLCMFITGDVCNALLRCAQEIGWAGLATNCCAFFVLGAL